MLFYGYMVVGLVVGVMSNFVGTKWTLLGSVLLVSAGILGSTWPYIDVAKWGIWRTVSETLSSGIFWYLVPSALFFIVPFLVGRYGYQFLLKTVLRSARG